jgi:hypothetical protein
MSVDLLMGDPILSKTPLATPDDVARVLAVEPTPDPPWAEAALETASSWARKFLRRPDLGTDGELVEKFFHIANNAFVPIEGVPVSVSVVAATGEAPTVLPTDLWEYDGEGIRLFPNPDVWWVNGFAKRAPWAADRGYYRRVEVTSEVDAEIDPIVRDGVAIAAAALITRAPRLAKGLNAERIGDYSYTLTRVETSDPWFEQAKSILRPMRRVPDLVP